MTPSSLQARLVAIRYAADATLLFDLMPVDGSAPTGIEPGAHIDVHLPNGLIRQYSLCNSPTETDRYVIGVKLDRNSRGGSAYMHNELRVGTLLEISEPRNHFRLNEAAPHSVLIAGGIGITPIAFMAEHLGARSRSHELHYSVRERQEAMFQNRLPGMQLHVDAEQAGQRFLDIAAIVRAAPADAHFYCCGPGPMLDAFVEATKDRPATHVHLERFAADVDAATDGGFVVELARAGRAIQVAPGQTILDAVRDCGLDVRASCEQGVCGACETRVLQGTPDHRDTLLSAEEKAANDVMMICCSGSLGPRLVLDL